MKTGELLQSVGPGFHLVLTHLQEGQHSQLCKLRQSNQHTATNSKRNQGMQVRDTNNVFCSPYSELSQQPPYTYAFFRGLSHPCLSSWLNMCSPRRCAKIRDSRWLKTVKQTSIFLYLVLERKPVHLASCNGQKKGEISSYGNSELVPIDFHQETM